MRETQQALILDSGCEAQVCNPFNREFCENRQVSCLSSDVCECQKADDFAKVNPPLPTTKEYKHLAGKVVNVVEVWQYKIGDVWHNVPQKRYTECADFKAYQNDVITMKMKVVCRRAFEVLSEEESKPISKTYRCKKKISVFTVGNTYLDKKGDGWFINDNGESHGIVPSIIEKYFEEVKECEHPALTEVTSTAGDHYHYCPICNYSKDISYNPSEPNQSVEQVAEKSDKEKLKEAAGKSWEYNSKTLGEPINPTAFVLGFGAGAGHIINSGEYVKLDDVVEQIGKYYNKLHSWQDANPKDMIAQIRNLKNKQ